MTMSDGPIRTYFDGDWHDGNLPVAGAADHGLWQGTVVFDGARAFEDVAPDLDLHCARANRSALALGLEPTHSDGEVSEIAREGIAKFGLGAQLYIRPMYWSRSGGPSLVMADPETTVFCMCIEALPLPAADRIEGGISVGVSTFRRPLQSMMPTEAKAACLYPNNGRMLREARGRGFDNALALDGLGNVAELATSNVFIVRGGAVATPVPNGTFLAGITRQRIISLLRAAGTEVSETVLTLADIHAADEIFSTGNALKVMPVTNFEGRALPFGPVARLARQLYWDFAHG
jgi:branched-chain amino acid aminotransferase